MTATLQYESLHWKMWDYIGVQFNTNLDGATAESTLSVQTKVNNRMQ